MTLQTRIPTLRRSPTVLIAGGAGFIGSHLCDSLLQRGNRVICLDNLFTGTIDNIRPLLNHPNFRFIEHDVREEIEIDDEIDRVYSLACPASPRHYQKDPVGTMKTCVLGTINLLELARRKGARVLQASTSEVYGDPEVHPQPESYLGNVNPIGPRACYDEGKRAAETLMFDYHRTHGTEIKVARIFNTYGPRMLENDGRVVSNFIVQALRGEPITIYGGGTQTRSFCFVDDLVRGLQLLMESPASVTGPCNLGNPHEVTIEAIAREVLTYTESASPLRFVALPKDDPKRRKPVIDTAAQLLGWRPRVALKDGLQATIAYFALRVADESPTLVPALARRKRGPTRGMLKIAD
ncbi:SDR family oxidoreductase [Bradyrhizobium sp. 180]|uniref:UDP-glucuronic acid decarboxylase family protein n=1 Tax=unclassified Bradyrhizobium TaxID=2631580 RepID=UPI001FFAF634|nr:MULTISPECIES: UDP-glucuronic acid decarboxylase family protein [unclassified Bradyrhizobium]MCK1424070.1 SDR family oxidoreductase [Bradyrhizobium sp. CW12]MCK1495187.1 SDR family oxidoreductase [Bradyrhizobium sp. 180]MCK1530994.1 SDR family oxidoreductase [Bradyrhizobium sp. 182]MCK1621667.1 SDR family oxidoreductase [Bradyrhizobium sp. 159]MCK1646832.1 SDR family oxidoreductase [Bradyrhizobium sp. 154]